MAKSYKTAIAFGLVYIPVDLYACVKSKDIEFNMLYKKTGERIKFKKTCETCPVKMTQDDIIKGYEYEKGKYITITQEELDKLKSDKNRIVTIESFVKLSEIDPIYFNKSYFVVPTGADNAFSLLIKAMQDENKVGISKCVLGEKENLIALRVINSQMIMTTLHFYDEVQENPKKIELDNVKTGELSMAKQIINNMEQTFEAKNYKNEFREKLKKAIEDKIKGKQIEGTPSNIRPHNVINLMDALKKTIKNSEKPKSKATKKSNKKEVEKKVVKLKKRA